MSTCIVYVSCADAREIDVWRLDSRSEAMARVERVPVPGVSEPSASMPLALGPDLRHLYAALRVAPYPVVTFEVDPATGRLTERGTGHLPDSMASIATDRSGRYLLGASYGGGLVGVSRIGLDGVVATEGAQTIGTPPKAHCILPSPDNRFAYAASLGGDTIHCWPIDAVAGLRADEGVTFPLHPGAGPRHLAFGRAALYVVNELDGTVVVLGRDADTGALTHRQTVETTPQNGAGRAAAADIRLTPNGRFLYASVRSTNTVVAFRVRPADGTLEALSTYEVEDTPRGFAITPDGLFLVSAGRNTSAIGVYAIDTSTGELSAVGRYATSANPNWIETLRLPE